MSVDYVALRTALDKICVKEVINSKILFHVEGSIYMDENGDLVRIDN